MRTSICLWALGLAMAACGGDGVRIDGPVIITGEDTFVSETGEATVQSVSGDLQITAFQPNDGMTALEPLEVEVEDGTARVPDAAPGEVYLRLDDFDPADKFFESSLTIVTEARDVDLGRVLGRREDARFSCSSPETYWVTATGLSPWTESDELHLYSPGAGLYFTYLHWGLYPPETLFQPGDTSKEWAMDHPEPLSMRVIEGDKGDQVFVYQMSPTPVGDITPLTTVRADDVSGYNQHESGSSLYLDMVEPEPSEDFELRWDAAAFEAFSEAASPSGGGAFHRFWLSASPAGAVYAGASADLVKLLLPADVETVEESIPTGQAFPPEWKRIASARSVHHEDFESRRIYATHWYYDLADRVDGERIEPAISPPRNLRVGGRPAQSALALEGTTHLVEWDPPEIGTATYYQVSIYGGPALRRVARVLTSKPRVLLELGGAQYVLAVSAVQTPIAFEERPLERTYPTTGATTLSGLLQAPDQS